MKDFSGALSDKHKAKVKTWVPAAARQLKADLEGQLERLGIRKGTRRPIEELPGEAERGVRRKVEALLDRNAIAEGSEDGGYDNVVRELAYTFLNRILGLKAMESRGLLYLPPPADPTGAPEETTIITPVEGQALSSYLRDFRAAGGARYKYDDELLYRDGLTAAFAHITTEIRILFDPAAEYACVWPTHASLKKLIDAANKDLPAEAFQARDFLGWVYQFFAAEENERVRAATGGIPRTSYELAVLNQFYTPHWVVKALVDNTLGRLWIQMHPDTALFSKPPEKPTYGTEPVADYLVPRTGERILYRRVSEEGQVETFKRARDIKLLDPACGTMHFGQYAFGLFLKMYEEEIAHSGEPGWPETPSVEDPERIPETILAHNLYGIDIDPRAIQIATLSLFLTAREWALTRGRSPLSVKVQRTNLAVANAVDLGAGHLRDLVGSIGKPLGDAALQEQLFKAVWDNLRFVGELGSLVQVKEGVTRVLDGWVERKLKERGFGRPMGAGSEQAIPLGNVLDEAQADQARRAAAERKRLEAEADSLKAELLAGLEEAATESLHDPATRLFAEDTIRGLHLLEILSGRYDVVVMNPPYGSFVTKVRDLVREIYPLTCNDIYAAFVDRATHLVEEHGYVGALVSNSFKTNTTLHKLRSEILLKRNPLIVLLDLGAGILEATVETAAVVLKGRAA